MKLINTKTQAQFNELMKRIEKAGYLFDGELPTKKNSEILKVLESSIVIRLYDSEIKWADKEFYIKKFHNEKIEDFKWLKDKDIDYIKTPTYEDFILAVDELRKNKIYPSKFSITNLDNVCELYKNYKEKTVIHLNSYEFYISGKVEIGEEMKENKLVYIPLYVANEIERLKVSYKTLKDIYISSYLGFSSLDGAFEDKKKVARWIKYNPKTFESAWINGYTVKQDLEQLYYIKLVKGEYGYLRISEKGELFVWIKTDDARMTEKQIKEINPNYWPFAVKVEDDEF